MGKKKRRRVKKKKQVNLQNKNTNPDVLKSEDEASTEEINIEEEISVEEELDIKEKVELDKEIEYLDDQDEEGKKIEGYYFDEDDEEEKSISEYFDEEDEVESAEEKETEEVIDEYFDEEDEVKPIEEKETEEAIDEYLDEEDEVESIKDIKEETAENVAEDDTDLEDVIISEKEHNLQGAKVRKHHTLIRIAAIICVFMITMFFAMGAGAGLALWNMNMSVSEFFDSFKTGGVVVQAAPGLKEFSIDTDYSSYTGLKEFSIEDLDDKENDTQKTEEESVAESEADTQDTTVEAEADAQSPVEESETKQSDSEGFVLTDEIANVKIVEAAGKNGEVLYENTEAAIPQDMINTEVPSLSDAASQEMVTNDAMTVDATTSDIMAAIAATEISSNGGIPQNVVYEDPNINYPLPFTEVSDSYFDDALFIGDSRMQGFGMHAGINATFYTAVGFQLYNYKSAKVVKTPAGKMPILDAIPYDAFTKIYIKVGLNEMGWGNEGKFEEVYAELIQKLREKEPRAIIYIHGLLPVTAWKSAEDSAHNNPNIFARNEALKLFALSQRAYYIDVNSVVSEPDGSLIAASASDGIHMMGSYMTTWKEYLRTHAVAR